MGYLNVINDLTNIVFSILCLSVLSIYWYFPMAFYAPTTNVDWEYDLTLGLPFRFGRILSFCLIISFQYDILTMCCALGFDGFIVCRGNAELGVCFPHIDIGDSVLTRWISVLHSAIDV